MAVKEKSRSEKKISKPKKFKPGVADTARNLFGREWITKNVDGTVDDFNIALAAITPTAAFQVCSFNIKFEPYTTTQLIFIPTEV